MDTITLRRLRAEKWKQAYSYSGFKVSFKTFVCSIEGLTLTHETPKGRPTRIFYSAFGRRSDSPSAIVRIYNDGVRAKLNNQKPAPGSVEQLREQRGSRHWLADRIPNSLKDRELPSDAKKR